MGAGIPFGHAKPTKPLFNRRKDRWNAVTPYSAEEQGFVAYFANPELGLYMDDSQFGGAVPALSDLRIQSMSYPAIGAIPGYFRSGI